MFNEYEMYQMMKLRQEEIESKARDAWKYQDLEKETIIQKVVKMIMPSNTFNKQVHCDCVCNC